MERPQWLMTVLVGAVLAVALAVGVTAARSDDFQPIDFVHNVTDAPAPVTGAVFGTAPATKTGTAICTTPTQTTANVNTDCEGVNPHNETSIAVNPTNTQNLIGGANDYQLGLNPGGHVSETILSRAHVTFDGGRSWAEYPITANSAYQATGDPAVAFDASGHAYYATLGFRFAGPVNAVNPDVVVANSGDGGKTWDSVRIATGSGSFGERRPSARKEYIAAWGAGNAIVTFGDFRLGQKGVLLTGQIFASVTHDFGTTWSKPVLISGDLNQAFVSVPTVAADGRIYVAFLNTTDLTTGRDDYEVVEVSPATGARGCRAVQGRDDDRRPHRLPNRAWQSDLPGQRLPHMGGRQHHRRPDERTAPCGRVVGHAEQHASRPNRSVRRQDKLGRDREPVVRPRPDLVGPGGAHARARPVDALGRLRRQRQAADRNIRPSVDAGEHLYGYTLATETSAGSLAFGTTQVTTALSDPTRATAGSPPRSTRTSRSRTRLSATTATSRSFPAAAGGVVSYWTDLRVEACFAGRCGHGEDAFFARTP